MARQARSASKLLLAIIWLGCKTTPDAASIPSLRVNAEDAALHHSNGVLLLRSQPFSGYLFALDGQDTVARTPYFNGREEGWCYKWYAGGQIMEARFFHEGKKEGLHLGWWPGGQKKFEYHFQNDEHEGLATEWFRNGQLFRKFHYSRGHEDGLEQMWWEDGGVRANYVVRNGQQYGLIGRKLCINPAYDKK